MSQTFNVVAEYHTHPGTAAQVLELLESLATASRHEPGNLSYEYFCGVEDQQRIVILEKYRTSEDFDAHRESTHFHEIAVSRIIPLLESRTVSTFIQENRD
jgi:quinol monooxygenase YgiN